MRRRMPLANLAAVLLAGTVAASGPAAITLSAVQASGTLGPGVPNFWVRPTFRVDRVADLPGVRFIEFGADGSTLFASRPGSGDIITLRRQSNGTYTQQSAFVTGQNRVHALDWHDGWLWFAETGSVRRARDTNGDGAADETVTVLSGLPADGGHWLRSLLVTNDAIYTGIGDSGNANDETATDRQKIWRYNLDGSGKTLWASGVRNTEKLRMRPGTNHIYGADHGSDNWGGQFGESGGNQPLTDVLPSCEFNRYESGGFYGHPFLVGDRIPRNEYRNRSDLLTLAAATRVPAWKFGAHWAPNGFGFTSERRNAPAFGTDAYVAMHGSWNSSVKVGYRIERVMFDDVYNVPIGGQPMVLTVRDGSVLGRPVDVVEDPNGGLLFSDDGTGRIYSLTAAKRLIR